MTQQILARRPSVADSSVFAVIVIVGSLGGALSAFHPRVGFVVIVAAVLAGAIAIRPILSAVLVPGASFAVTGVGVLGLSVSDVILITAALLALPAMLVERDRAGNVLNRALGIYLISLLPSLAFHPTALGMREWVHRLILVGASAAVGAWLWTERCVTQAFRGLVGAAAIVASAAVVQCVRDGFAAAYPLTLHKNYAGSLLALTVILLVCAPGTVRANRWHWPLVGLLAAGLLATQSRGAILSVGLGGFIWLFSPSASSGELRVTGRARVLALALGVTFTLYAVHSVQEQFAAPDARTNSAGVRQQVEHFTQELWRTSPLVGVGIRYYNVTFYGPFGQASNNAINSELAESGVVGAAGFVALHALLLAALFRRRREQLGLAGFAVVAGSLLHGMFDIYWSSGTTTLAFVIAGVAVAGVRPARRTRGARV